MQRVPLSLAFALLLAACGRSNPPEATAFTPGPQAPFSTTANPNLSLPPCALPAGTIGLPDQLSDPLPDRGNGLAAGAASDAPADLHSQIVLRTDTETYNRRYQFALRDGRLWFKSNTAVSGIEQPWAAAALPACLVDTLIGISLDDDELIAIRADGAIYGMDNALKDSTLFNWSSRWGPPLWTGSGHRIPPAYRAWSWSVISPLEDQHWTDPAGNRHAARSADASAA